MKLLKRIDCTDLPFSRRLKKLPTPWNTLLYNRALQDIIGWGYGCTSGTALLLHMKVTNIVPLSTITVPPPLNLLMTGISSFNTDSSSRSSAGFLCSSNSKLISLQKFWMRKLLLAWLLWSYLKERVGWGIRWSQIKLVEKLKKHLN